jgi:N-formylmaleamate deformylase
MEHWTQGEVATDGATLRYFRSGGDRPALVMVHGLTDQALYFTRVAEALAEDWDVVAYDARGHGRSSRITDTFDEPTRVADLVGVVDALGLDRPALVGHSMGGGTITLALATHPDLARGAVLEDPAWWEPPPAKLDRWLDARRAHFAEWHATLADLQRRTHEDALARRLAEYPNWSPVDVRTSLDGRFAVQPAALDHFCEDHRPWRPLVARFTCPTLVVIGDDDPSTVVSRADAEAAAASNPLVQWTRVAGAGHHIRYDRFDEYLAATTTFLATLDHR